MAKIPEGYEAVIPEGYEVAQDYVEPVERTTPLQDALSVAGNQMQNVAEGATLGWRDEAEAALSSAIGGLPYSEALKDIESRRAQANIDNQYELPAKLAGGLFTGALTGKAFNPSSVVGTAALGGAEGLIAGAGLSDSTLMEDPTGLTTDAAIGATIGAVAGPSLGAVGNMAFRSMKPMAQRIAGWIKGSADDVRQTTHQRNLQTAKEFDIPTTAPERMADDRMMMKQARYESDEDLMTAVTGTLDDRANRINQIAREQIGLPPANDINRVDLGEAAKNISSQFKSIEKNYGTATLDDDLFNQLDSLVPTKSITKPPQKAIDAVNRTMELLDDGMTGKQYLQQRSLLDKEIQSLYKAEKPDVRLAETYSEIIEILDDKFASQLDGEAAAVLKDARFKWKNLRLLDRPNAVQGGDVRLGSVKTGLNRNKGFLRGMDQSPLARLSDLHDSTKFNFGRSGTAERTPDIMQKIRSSAEMPFANANISRGGLIPGFTNIRGASQAGGLLGATGVPPVVIGAEDELELMR